MSFLQRLWAQVNPTLESIELGPSTGAVTFTPPEVLGKEGIKAENAPASVETEPLVEKGQPPEGPVSHWSLASRWFFNDMLFIAMLLLALAGVMLRLPVTYWIFLTPVFGLISIVEGWSHFSTPNERLGHVFRVAAIWGALLVAIFLLYDNGVQGVLNANGTSLAMITLLALGTFVAGIQARVWQICAIGAILFISVPGVGWLDQSPLLMAGATVFAIAIGALVWWIRQLQSPPAVDLNHVTLTPVVKKAT